MSDLPKTAAHPRRQTRAFACVQCRKKKVACDRHYPCGNCKRARVNKCSFLPGIVPDSILEQQPRLPTADAPNKGQDTASNSRIEPRPGMPDGIAAQQVSDREHSLASEGSLEQWSSSKLGDLLISTPKNQEIIPTRHFQIKPPGLAQDSRPSIGHLLDTSTGPIQRVIYDTTFRSSSNWLHSSLLMPHALDWMERATESDSPFFSLAQTCQALSQSIRQRRLDWTHGDYGKYLPNRDTADTLLECYFRSFESIFRIVHVPSFRRDYEGFWRARDQSPLEFLIKLQLCLALGTCLESDVHKMRSESLHWIREADDWLHSQPASQVTLSIIQISCLTNLAHTYTQSLQNDSAWIRYGSIIRSAMSIGLHRDPSKLPPKSEYEAQIRRRLWWTLLELSLDSALESGAPPSLNINDFDCDIPANIDDSDLESLGPEGNITGSSEAFTNTSLQIAIQRSFSLRLAILEHSNSLKSLSLSYQKVMELNSQLTAASHQLLDFTKTFQQDLSDFQSRWCEKIMSRYIFTLHIPFLPVAQRDYSFNYSRNACVDAAAQLISSILNDYPAQHGLPGGTPSQSSKDYMRLVLCGVGSIRSVYFQASLVVAFELAARLQQPAPHLCTTRPNKLEADSRNRELLSLLEVGCDLACRRIMSGQHNVKDYVFLSIIVASIHAMDSDSSIKLAMDEKGRQAYEYSKSVLSDLLGNGPVSIESQTTLEENNFCMTDQWTDAFMANLSWNPDVAYLFQ